MSGFREELVSGEKLERREELEDLLEKVGHREDLLDWVLLPFFMVNHYLLISLTVSLRIKI